MKTLIIVESPKKAKMFQTFLGDKYIVDSSFGHVRDLMKEADNFGIDINDNFKPTYTITNHKKVNELKNAQKQCSEIILATDLDREGEAIAWHLSQVLHLKNPKRIIFNNTAKKAIEDALKCPRELDMNIVNSQQARRIIDRLVGFELSPLLWKNISNAKSAGRVQSVITKLIIDREEEIKAFSSKSSYKITGEFNNGLLGSLDKNIDANSDTVSFLDKCKDAIFTIDAIEKKNSKRFPTAPFRTSTMQQEVGNKLHMSSKTIMEAAQVLYENGLITYHRTDCVDISDEALAEIKEYITNKYGKQYLNVRKYKTSVKSAQEAHECIRPVDIKKENINETHLTEYQKKLYEIIWKKTVSSQMSPCEVEVNTIKISIKYAGAVEVLQVYFLCKAEKITFIGYKIIYDYKDDVDETSDTDDKASASANDINLKLLEKLKCGDVLKYTNITATEKFSKATPRYSEPALTKKMEELGIGRPATTANAITTIQEREYVKKDSRKGKSINYKIYILEKNTVMEKTGSTTLENDKNKLFPTELGIQVNTFLSENFPSILNDKFTSTIETELDEIRNGKKTWQSVVKYFYDTYHPNVEILKAKEGKITGSGSGSVSKKLLGQNSDGLNIYAYTGKFGDVIQIGTEKNKTKFISLKDTGYRVDTITEKDANDLIEKMMNVLGRHKGKEVILKNGKFGKYINYDGKNYSIKPNKEGENNKEDTKEDTEEKEDTKEDTKEKEGSTKEGESDEEKINYIEKHEITLEKAIEIIETPPSNNTIKIFNPTTKIMRGQYGLFIISGKKMVSLPKTFTDEEASKLTLQGCKDIISTNQEKPKRKYTKKN